MPTAQLSDLNVHYETRGTGAQHVVLVHALRHSGATWLPLIERLDQSVLTTWAIDLPGCGASDAPADWTRCTIDRYADDIVSFCDVVGIADVVLVGHSMGAAVASVVALEQPDLVAGLILVAPNSFSGLGFLTEEQFESLIHPEGDALDSFVLSSYQHPAPADHLTLVRQVVAAASPAHEEGGMRSMRELALLDRIGGINAPTLLLAGDRDRHAPISHALTTAAAIRRCGVQVWHGVGHSPQVEVPDECAGLMQRWITDELPVLRSRA